MGGAGDHCAGCGHHCSDCGPHRYTIERCREERIRGEEMCIHGETDR